MGILIRAATLKDKAWLIACAMEQAKELYPRLRANKDKIEALVIDCISSAAHYAQVIEEDGELQGCLLVMVNHNMWAERRAANIHLWVSRVPTLGAKLLREFRDWFGTRRGIRVAGMVPDFDWPDERIGRLIERIGFTKCGGSYLLYN